MSGLVIVFAYFSSASTTANAVFVGWRGCRGHMPLKKVWILFHAVLILSPAPDLPLS